MNEVTFILGRAKAGKTYEILSRIKKNEKAGEPSLLIVPSGYTYEYEKKLAKICGGGFMNTTVCGFYNFGQKVLKENGLDKAFITEQGRVMLIRKALENADLTIFASAAKKRGFAQVCDDIISNFVTCELTPDEVADCASKMDKNSVLHEKLTDLAAVYELTDKYLTETGQVLRAACKTICDSIPTSKLCDSHVYIDGIENPGEQTYQMIAGLMGKARSMTVALKVDLKSDESVFDREKSIYARLKDLCSELDIKSNVVILTGNYIEDEALSHIEKYLFSHKHEVFAGNSDSIRLFVAEGMRQEVENAAAIIKDLTARGTRYRNIAVVAGDTSVYSVLIKRIFASQNIPVFCDSKLSLSSTQAAVAINAALCCVAENYRTSDVVTLMKTGMCGITRDEAEILENYMLSCGIKGSELKKPLVRGKVPPIAEDARQKLILPLETLRKEMAHGNAEEKTNALENYLERIGMKERLENMTADFETNNDRDSLFLSKAYGQVWDKICEVLAQLKSVMGDSRMSGKDYAMIVDEGMNSDLISTIPPGLDMVTFMGVESCMPFDTEYVFILGASEGSLPPVRPDSGMIDDSDLARIKEMGLDVWLSTESLRLQDEENLYTLFTSAQKGLYISYPVNGASDKAVPCKKTDTISELLSKKEIMPCRVSLHSLVDAAGYLRHIADTGENDDAKNPYLSYYINNDDCFATIMDAVFFSPSPAHDIDRDLTERVFANNGYTDAGRLEQYNACPFAYLVEYGLQAKPRKIFDNNIADDGTVCHAVLDEFVKSVMISGLPYEEFTDEECYSLIEEIAERVFKNYHDGVYFKDNIHKAEMTRLISEIKDTVCAIMRHMRCGLFRFYGSEIKFGGVNADLPPIVLSMGDGRKLFITGKIDRIDKTDDAEKYRIVDYKRSDRKAESALIAEGIEMQLALYMSAIDAVYAGSAYMQTHGAIINFDDKNKTAEELLTERFKMRGIIVEEMIGLSDNNATDKSNRVFDKPGSCLISTDDIQKIAEMARKKAVSTMENILNGKFPVMPYKYIKKDSCEYCDYKSVCMYSDKFMCKKREIEPMKPEVLIQNYEE